MQSEFVDIWLASNNMRHCTPSGLDNVDVANLMADNLAVVESLINRFVCTFRQCDAYGMLCDTEHDDNMVRFAKTAIFDWPAMEMWLLGLYVKASLNRLRANNYTYEIEGAAEYYGDEFTRRTDLMRVNLWMTHNKPNQPREFTLKMKNFISGGWYSEWTHKFRMSFRNVACCCTFELCVLIYV